MEDLLKLKDAQIEALQRRVQLLSERLEEANTILSEMVNEMQVINAEIIKHGTK